MNRLRGFTFVLLFGLVIVLFPNHDLSARQGPRDGLASSRMSEDMIFPSFGEETRLLAEVSDFSCHRLKSTTAEVVEDLRRVTDHLHVFLTRTCSGYWTYGSCFEQHGEQIRPISIQINTFSDALENHVKALRSQNIRGLGSTSFQGLESLKREAQRSAEMARDRLEKGQQEAARGSRTTAARLASEGAEALKKLTQTLFQICHVTSQILQSAQCVAES